MRDEKARQQAYDRFLKKKMENLQEDMQRIENVVAAFEGTTLLGITRDEIKDTFSDVNLSLE